MPGIDLNLDLPSLVDTFTDIVTKLTTAISTIEDDLADAVNSGEIDINAPLSANGQPIINVGGLRLAGGASSVTGTLYTDGAELFYQSAAGPVQITANGAIDIAALGAIGGDYGSGDELLSYDLPSHEYRMYADPANEWADVVLDDLVLMESFGGGSVRLGVDAAITTARSFIFKDLPGSGISCLVYDASTSTVEDAANSRITNDVKVTTLNASGNVTLAGALSSLKHGDQTLTLTISDASPVGGTYAVSAASNFAKASINPAQVAHVQLAGIRTGHRVKKVHWFGPSLGAPVLSLFKQNTSIATAVASTVTGGTGIFGFGNEELNVTSPAALVAGESMWIKVDNSGNPNSFDYNAILVTYDTP